MRHSTYVCLIDISSNGTSTKPMKNFFSKRIRNEFLFYTYENDKFKISILDTFQLYLKRHAIKTEHFLNVYQNYQNAKIEVFPLCKKSRFALTTSKHIACFQDMPHYIYSKIYLFPLVFHRTDENTKLEVSILGSEVHSNIAEMKAEMKSNLNQT